MFEKYLRFILVVLCLCLITGESNSSPLIDYLHLTNSESPEQRVPLPFWTPDTLWGPVRSNDLIAIRFSPHFYDRVITSQDHFIEDQANPHFEFDPIFNAPLIEFPEELEHLRRLADARVEDENGRMVARIHFDGEDGIDIYQYPIGDPDEEELFAHLEAGRHIIYVDGEIEVSGILAGNVTVYSSRDIGLLDNVRYLGAHELTGGFDEDEMQHSLALVAQRNIIVKDTEANGRADGFNEDEDDFDRHSIVINGALIALRGSFTFEHQNDRGDDYQGPTPDERGWIILKGSLAQYTRGYVHRSNHQGTGYRFSRNYDYRFAQNDRLLPPGFEPGADPHVNGNYERLNLDDRHPFFLIDRAVVDVLTVEPGAEMKLRGFQPITVNDSLIIEGTPEQPVRIYPENLNMQPVFRAGPRTYIRMRHVIFEEGVETNFGGMEVAALNCTFGGTSRWTGSTRVDSCFFAAAASFASSDVLRVERSIFEAGMELSGRFDNGLVANNTFVKSRFYGVRIRSFAGLTIENNIAAFNRDGIVNNYYETPVMRYNDVYGNSNDDFVDCEAGAGSISADPLFRNFDRGDYHLLADSPCIDAGSPNSPRDPDGSRADIGAHSFFQDPASTGSRGEIAAAGFALLSAYPNPFNSSSIIRYELPEAGKVIVDIYDANGRRIDNLVDQKLTAGQHKITWDGMNAPSGVYYCRVNAVGQNRAVKLMLIR